MAGSVSLTPMLVASASFRVVLTSYGLPFFLTALPSGVSCIASFGLWRVFRSIGHYKSVSGLHLHRFFLMSQQDNNGIEDTLIIIWPYS
jgi:hypothetical protein